jgi:Ca2+-binding RTX toxin-like protein
VGDYCREEAGAGIDTIRSVIGVQLFDNIENLELSESAFNGHAYGNNLNNVIRANSGSNEIIGFGGADTMYGGAGTDTFKYISVTDSAPLGQGLTDYIADFNQAEGDRIDLSRIDANVNVDGNQSFLFIGNNNAFVDHWGAGQLRFNNGFVEGDVNGDFVADFAIEVNASALTDYAFML